MYVNKGYTKSTIMFDELIDYGKQHSDHVVNGMPWSFEYNGCLVTHENDECYIILILDETFRFTPNDILIEYTNGKIFVSTIDWFIQNCIEKEIIMNFGEALGKLKEGKSVARKGWNGKGIFIKLQLPDEFSKMTSPYIYIDTTGLQTNNPDAPKSRVPWLASQTDMLAEDWQEVME